MAQNLSHRTSTQSSNFYQPLANLDNGESSRSRPERSDAVKDSKEIKLKRLKFYCEEKSEPLYQAEIMPFEPNPEKIGEGAQAILYKTTIKADCFEGRYGIISNVSILIESLFACLTLSRAW
jgi:hypothetical protein